MAFTYELPFTFFYWPDLRLTAGFRLPSLQYCHLKKPAEWKRASVVQIAQYYQDDGDWFCHDCSESSVEHVWEGGR